MSGFWHGRRERHEAEAVSQDARDSIDEWGEPMSPAGPLGDFVDAIAEPLEKVQRHAVRTRVELNELRRRSERNWLGVRVALALVAFVFLVGVVTVVGVIWALSGIAHDNQRGNVRTCERGNDFRHELNDRFEALFRVVDEIDVQAAGQLRRQDRRLRLVVNCDATARGEVAEYGPDPTP